MSPDLHRLCYSARKTKGRPKQPFSWLLGHPTLVFGESKTYLYGSLRYGNCENRVEPSFDYNTLFSADSHFIGANSTGDEPDRAGLVLKQLPLLIKWK